MIQSGYTKLFGSIVASTIWREDDKTRIVWITLLALSDKDGFVAASIPGLADLARVSIVECEQALEKLQRPDKYSRSPEHGGRRIEAIDGGWFILNRAKYRDLDRDESHRLRQQRYRDRKRDVTRDAALRDVTQKEKEKKKETEKEGKSKRAWTAPSLAEVAAYCQERKNRVDPERFIDHYTENGWMRGPNHMKDWKATMRYSEKNGVNYGKANGSGNRAQQRQASNIAAHEEACRTFALD